jgi:hypothetical protein
MNMMRKVLTALGGIFLAALFLAALAPKATRAVAAALVQVVPGTATHMGQNEGRMVSLFCEAGNNFCNAVNASGALSTAAYEVPAGFTLVVTDYEYKYSAASSNDAGQLRCDNFYNVSNVLSLLPIPSCALVDTAGFVYGKEHFTTGIRVGSGVTVADFDAASRLGFAAMQGYLVPNS